MTWALTSTLLVGVCALAGLAWFERSRPSARQVALVAAVAALAVASRVAFAPIPSVKPTTDLVLLAGFVFGAAPGFVVGATTALVSNIAFGQGLHTPWQMLGWGAIGLLGAAVARVVGRRPPPLLLAAICGAGALAFSCFMDLSVWAQTAPTHSATDYLAIVVRGLPFSLAHAVTSAVFALLFGRVVITALDRARARAEIEWLPIAPRDRGEQAGTEAARATTVVP